MTNTSENIITILNEITEELQSGENVAKLHEARESIGNEMLKMMQFMFPMVMEIEMAVIKKHGFPAGREGIVQFSQLVRHHEREDSEVARLHNQIRACYLPQVGNAATSEPPLDVIDLPMDSIGV